MNASIALLILIAGGLVVLTLLGIAWLIIRAGRRGVLIDDHPLCRACGFDLVALPDSSERCSECGADLTQPGKVIHGHTKPRAGLLVSGVAMLAVTLILAAGITLSTARAIDFAAYKPTWWVLREANSSSRPLREDAMARLIARDEAGTLDPARRQQLIELALAHQANAAIPWDPAWGTYLSDRLLDGTLSETQRDRFVAEMIAPAAMAMTLRKDIRVGDPLRLNVLAGGTRMPGMTNLAARYRQRDERYFVDGRPLKRYGDVGDSGGASTLTVAPSIYSTVNAEQLVGIVEGEHEIEFRSKIDIVDGFDRDARLVASVPVLLKGRFILHPRNTDLVSRIVDPKLAPRFASLWTASIELESGPRASVRLDSQFSISPTGYAFDVVVCQGKREWLAGTMCAQAGPTGSWHLGTSLEGIQPGTADIVLRTNPEAAKWSVDVFEIWEGEVVLKNVPVKP